MQENKVGRPNLSESDLHINRISVLLNEKYDDALSSIAEVSEVPKAVLARKLIIAGLKHHLIPIQPNSILTKYPNK